MTRDLARGSWRDLVWKKVSREAKHDHGLSGEPWREAVNVWFYPVGDRLVKIGRCRTDRENSCSRMSDNE